MLTRMKTLTRQILIQVTMVTNQLRIPTMPKLDMIISKLIQPVMDSKHRLDTVKPLRLAMVNNKRRPDMARLLRKLLNQLDTASKHPSL